MISLYKRDAHDVSKLILLLPLVFLLFPRPGLPGGQFITYSLMGFLIIAALVLMKKRAIFDIDRRVVKIFILLYVYAALILCSMLYNSGNAGFAAITHFFKPVFFAMIFYFGYAVSISKDLRVIKKTLLRMAYTVLVMQSLVGVDQLLGLEIFSFLYSTDKVRPFGGMVRIAGTLGNPNIFAWIVIQMAVIVLLFEERKLKKISWLAISVALIVLSGSRTMLLLMPFVLFFAEIMANRKTAMFYFFKVPFYAGAFFLFVNFGYWFIMKYGVHFPYLFQIVSVFDTGSLESVNSFHLRTLMWDEGLATLGSSGSILPWIFGVGPGVFSEMDNDYLYALVNYGVLFTIVHVLLYTVVFIYFTKLKDRKFRVLGQQYIIFAFVIGAQADTMIGWTYPVLVLFYAGLAVSILNNKNTKEESEMSEPKKKKYKFVW